MTSKVKENSYITIQGFMVTELGLKGNELLIYAIIYGFSQDGESKYNGGLQYLADWCNSTKQGVMKALKSLIEKGLVHKEEVRFNGVKMCEYRVERYETKFHEKVNKVERGMQQSLMGYATKFNEGIKQSLPNNIEDNIKDNIEDSIKEKKEKKRSTQKPKEVAPIPSIEELQQCFGRPVGTGMAEWFQHKAQRGDTYTPTGLDKLLSMVRKNVAAYGEQAVADLIELSIASGWQGIAWDRLKTQKPTNQQNSQPPQSGNVFVEILRKSEAEGVDPF
ncbi:MAG: helix-turn-helix domain-containing protein [Butyricicoccus sp.]